MDFVEPIEYEMAMQELRRGRDLVLMLQNLTTKPSSADGRLVDARKVVEEVLLALNTPITMLSRSGANVSGHKPAVTVNHHKYSPETPDGSRKIDTVGICEQIGGRRQRYRSLNSEWTSTPFDDDGFIWKKYGQKKIHGAKYHRMYYKCSQSTYQGCQATKQVQRANGDPSLFAVTRIGEHTCKKVIYASDFALDDSTSKTPFRIIFGSSCRPSSSSTSSSLDYTWPRREETQEDLRFPETTSASTVITRSHGEFQKLSEVYIGKSLEQSLIVPPDSLSPTSCQMSTTDLTGDLRGVCGELLLQEEDCFFLNKRFQQSDVVIRDLILI